MNKTNYQKIDKLSSLVESCIENIQFTVMCEAEGDQKSNKIKTLAKKAWEGVKYALRLLVEAFRTTVTKLGNLGRNESVLTKDVVVSKYVFIGLPASLKGSLEKLKSVARTYGEAGNAKDVDKEKIATVIETIETIIADAKDKKAITLKKDTKVRTDSLRKTAGTVGEVCKTCEIMIGNAGKLCDPVVVSVLNKVITYLKTVIDDIDTVINAAAVVAKVEKSGKLEPVQESTSVIKMKLLTEAFKLLNESDEVETVAIASDGEKPEVEYDDIDDVIEEEESVDEPYNPEVNGGTPIGEEEEPVLDDEAITDLLDGHEEALEILKEEEEGTSDLIEAEPEVAKDTGDTPADDDVDNANTLAESIYGLNW